MFVHKFYCGNLCKNVYKNNYQNKAKFDHSYDSIVENTGKTYRETVAKSLGKMWARF